MTYQKTTYGYFTALLFGLIALLTLASAYYQLGNKPIPMNVAIFLAVFFFIISLSFYKVTITINGNSIVAKFGIGLFKKTMLLSEIDKTSVKIVKFPWYTGIGIRLTSEGTLYNVRVGMAILIKNKKHTKTFLVGTDDALAIKEILSK